MSNPRYIHIDSNYRNRFKYPEPYAFDVEVNCGNGCICYPSNIQTNYVNFGDTCLNSPPILYKGSIPSSSSNVVPLVDMKNDSFVNPVSNAAPVYLIRVQSLANPGTLNPLPLPIITDVFSGGSNLIPRLNILNTVSIDDYYNGYYIIKNPNLPNPEMRIITDYDSTTRCITLNQPFSSLNIPADDYVLADPTSAVTEIQNNFLSSVYRNFTNASIALAQLPLGIDPVIHFQFEDVFGRRAPFFDNQYADYYATISFTNECRKIKSYNKSLNIGYLEKLSSTDLGPQMDYYNNYFISISYEKPFYISGNPSNDDVYFNTNDVVVNKYIPINTNKTLYVMLLPYIDVSSPNAYPPINPESSIEDPILLTNEKNKINKYIYKVIKTACSKTCDKTYLQVCGSIPSEYFTPSHKYSLLLFYANYDSNYCIQYYGNQFPTSNPACYEIELLKLILPNVDLVTGSRIAFYPYVLVQFTNSSNTVAHLKFILESNNPHASDASFVCSIDDVTNPIVSSFVKIDGNGMTQTMKFVPNQDISFRVYLPNGEPFEPVEKDTIPPLPTNRIIQISCSFSFRKI
jgi:hypothetical protein